MSQSPIAEYALLSNCQTAALVHRSGRVDWLCFPRFDSPAQFARLLDDDGGHWTIRPREPATITRRYRPRSMVLETTFSTDGGTVVLTDALAVGDGERHHDLGMASPRVLLRQVHGTAGSVTMQLEYAPRPEYGLVFPLLTAEDGDVLARGGAAVLRLSTPVPCETDADVARAEFTLREGECTGFALEHGYRWEPPSRAWSQDEIERRLSQTDAAWCSWSERHQRYDGPYAELVHQSGRVLQALTYAPTGAVVAAPTTSLPEDVGGERNWDYRFCWLRDASLTLEALWIAACPDEAQRFFDFVASAALVQVRRGGGLQIMFGVGGEHDCSERDLAHLRGWRGSRPVRVGNAAWRQTQLDVSGELLGAVHRLRHQLEQMPSTTKEFLVDVAELAARHWRDPDHGIWEVRGPPRDYTHSKLMCWVALDRAIDLADVLGAAERVTRWRREREAIRQAIETHGWSEEAGAFVQSFGSTALDASTLLLPIVGFLGGDDPRVRSTIDAIAERLTDERGLVYRYRASDNLPGSEGSFLLCTFWLAAALARSGEPARARAVFERATAFLNDVGLLSEEVDAAHGELLGNFPQAFSHIGLVNAAWAIAQAEAPPQGEGLQPRHG